jgi:hypothetical protein
MNMISRLAVTALLTGGLALGSIGVEAGTAVADGMPGCDHPEGPCHWCPGEAAPITGNHVTDPVVWDWNICHTYWRVYPEQGNVSNMIFDGPVAPPPPPPPPPALISTREQCEAIFGAFLCPH